MLTFRMVQELLAADGRATVHRDPGHPRPETERAPAGMATFRERRFAASPS